MRKILLFAILAIVCNSSFAQKDSDKKRVEGSGNVITKTFPITSFDQLEVGGVFNVELSQSSSGAVKVEADDNLMELFEVKNEGEKLMVTTKKDVNINTKSKVKVYISFKKINSLEIHTVGNVSSAGELSFDKLKLENNSVGNVSLKFSAQSVKINNNSVGSVKLEGKADDAVIKSNSVGTIKAGDFVVQTMDIDNNGVGSAEVNAAKELKVRDSFLG